MSEINYGAVKLSEADRKVLESAGVRLFYGEIPERRHTLRELARTCDMAEAWVRVQLKEGKIPGKKTKSGNRSIWTVEAATVVQIRQEQIDKHLERAKRKATGKTYAYRRPTEWAYHLTVKAINSDGNLTKAQKNKFLEAMERYKVDWEEAYQERLAKKAENAAEEDEDDAD